MIGKKLLVAVSLLAAIATNVNAENNGKSDSFSQKDATNAIDAFHKTFYNPEMKLYAISSDGKGRAAIWVQAIYWDMIMNAYKRTGDERYKTLIKEIYQGGYEQYSAYDWTDEIEWFIYDDMMWWIISLGRAYQITGDPCYLADASSGFFYVWKESYDEKRGGMWWNFKHDAKMACINFPTIVGAMTLYECTKNKSYLEKAMKLYDWSRKVFLDAKQGCVADNIHYHFQRPNGMDVDWTTQLYNQGTFIGSAVMLYKATKEKRYLDDAILAADYVKDRMCDSEGMLPFKNGIEQGCYAAIFAQYISMLIEDGGQKQYLPWLQKYISKAWEMRDKQRNITFKDVSKLCPEGVIESYDASGCPALMQLIPSK